MEQILINLAVKPPETAIELPIREAPGIDQAHGVRADFLEQFHHGLGARELDLADGDGGGGEELRGLALEGMQRIQAEQFPHQRQRLGVEFVLDAVRAEGLVEVLHDEVLRLGGTQTPKVDEEGVPGLLVFVAVFEGFEGQEG